MWKHPWVCLSENHLDDEPALWVFVNEILLDSSNEALILDCCILPVERRGGAVSTQLGAAVEIEQLRGNGVGIAGSTVRGSWFDLAKGGNKPNLFRRVLLRGESQPPGMLDIEWEFLLW